jgi:hypothetical protein
MWTDFVADRQSSSQKGLFNNTVMYLGSMTYRRVLDWMTGFTDTLYIHSELQAINRYHYFHALQFTVTLISVLGLH